MGDEDLKKSDVDLVLVYLRRVNWDVHLTINRCEP